MKAIGQQEAPYPFTPARFQGKIDDKEDFYVIAMFKGGEKARIRLWWVKEKARDNKLLLEYLNFFLPFCKE